MALIITIANTKGGVGKTCIARNLALTFYANNERTLAVDCDPQGSLENFFRDRAERLDVIEVKCIGKKEAKGLKREILAYAAEYDRVVIDVGGRDTDAMRQVLLASDIVIIPTSCGQESIDAIPQIISAVEDARSFNEGLQAYILINLAPSDPHDTTATAAAEGLAENYGQQAQILDARLKHRKAWMLSAFGGFAIWEVDTKANKAADEFASMIVELLAKEVI
jgi:chromosome partitioning protein